jgi:hypothetical protein
MCCSHSATRRRSFNLLDEHGFEPTQVAHRAVTDSCNRSVSHTCETDPYQACYISVLQEFCLELLCFTGFGKSLFHRSGTDLLSSCNT